MQLIFESETEVGQCDPDRIDALNADAESGNWVAVALTTAAMTGSMGMLRVEQRCFLRSTEQLDEVRVQNWIKPEIILEPASSCKQERLRMLQTLHEQYVQKARAQFGDQLIGAGSA
jgi:hypothetical protein